MVFPTKYGRRCDAIDKLLPSGGIGFVARKPDGTRYGTAFSPPAFSWTFSSTDRVPGEPNSARCPPKGFCSVLAAGAASGRRRTPGDEDRKGCS